jgi:hypothetical protein
MRFIEEAIAQDPIYDRKHMLLRRRFLIVARSDGGNLLDGHCNAGRLKPPKIVRRYVKLVLLRQLRLAPLALCLVGCPPASRHLRQWLWRKGISVQLGQLGLDPETSTAL